MGEYGQNFIDQKNFESFVKESKIFDYSTPQNSYWLEYLEKEKILFPQARIVFPKNYVKLISNVHLNPPHKYYNKKFPLSHNFHLLYKLQEKISTFYLSRDLFHPLFKKNSYTKKYVKQPKRMDFIPHKRFKILVANINGLDYKEDYIKNYYSYWQIYYLYDITKACTQKLLINIFDEKVRQELWKLKIPDKKIIGRTLPLKYNFANGDFFGKMREFEFIGFYVESVIKLEVMISHNNLKHKPNSYGLLDKEGGDYLARIKKIIASQALERFKISKNDVIEFIRFLVKKYQDYEKDNKEKLKVFISNDIWYLVEILTLSFELKYTEIKEAVGRNRFAFKYDLEHIFPEEFSEEKDNVIFTLPSFLSSKLTFNKFLKVEREEVIEFLDFIEVNNLHLIYHSLGYINNNIHHRIPSTLRLVYLSLILESLTKLIISKNENILDEKLNEHGNLSQKLKILFKQEGWYPCLKTNWHEFTKFSKDRDIDKYLLEIIPNERFHKNEEWDNIVKTFLVAGFGRNISAHENTIINGIRIESFLSLVNNTTSTIWFIWVYAKVNKLI